MDDSKSQERLDYEKRQQEYVATRNRILKELENLSVIAELNIRIDGKERLTIGRYDSSTFTFVNDEGDYRTVQVSVGMLRDALHSWFTSKTSGYESILATLEQA